MYRSGRFAPIRALAFPAGVCDYQGCPLIMSTTNSGLVPQAGFEPARALALTSDPPDSKSGVYANSTIGAAARDPTWESGPCFFGS